MLLHVSALANYQASDRVTLHDSEILSLRRDNVVPLEVGSTAKT